ncbi:uncharacterized protein [Solanum lycopersicum]|uniref:uncharacterized protein n=1 Tax=Solanum lycopersicum TaxID=4081 RepID=UPI003747A0CD
MAITRANAQWERDGSGEQDMPPQLQGHVPPQVQEQVPPRVPNDLPIGNAMLEEFRASMTLLAQALTAQDNKGEVAPTNCIGRMSAARVREFFKMNPPEFHGSKVEEDWDGFLMSCIRQLREMQLDQLQIMPLESVAVKDSLSYEDVPVEILDSKGKANVVDDALSRLYMGRTVHVEEEKWVLDKDVHRLARLEVRPMDSKDGGILVTNGAESSLVSEVKEK